MNLVKKLGDSLDSKIKSGEINESELMEEASEIMKNLQKVPGMKNLLGSMGMSGMSGGKNSKLNLGAMQGKMSNNIKLAKQKERMRKKLASRNQEKDEQIRILQEQLDAAKK